MTVRGYTRVSSAQQTEKFSLAAQQDKIEAWAQFQNLKPVRLYEERGISGTRNDRPELAALLDDLRPDDTVVVYSLSRLGRGGVVQLLGIVGQIRERGARLVSLTESVDTESTTGRLMLTLLAALAEMEIEVTRERTTGGRLQAASQGIYPHNAAGLPFGYGRGEDGRVAEGERADDLRHVFTLAAGGTPYHAVAEALNAARVPTKRGAERWSASTIMRIITTDVYMTGVYPYRQAARPDEPEAWIPIPMPPLVSPETWHSAQRPRSRNHAHRNPEKYPLTGHVECACGAALQGSDNRPTTGRPRAYRYYVCRADVRRTPTCPATGAVSKNYAAERVEAQARAALVTALRSPAALAALAQQAAPPTDPHAEERDRLTTRRAALIDLHLDGLIDRAEFTRRRADLDARLAALTPAPLPPVPETPALTAYAAEAEQLDGDAWREFLTLLQVRWRVGVDGVEVAQLSIPV